MLPRSRCVLSLSRRTSSSPRFRRLICDERPLQTAQSTRAALCDLVYSSTDVLLLQARTTFAPAVRSSHSTCLGLINRALALLSASAIGPADRAKLKRFSSGTAYHFGGKIYKEGRAVDGIALLQVGCVVAAEALRDWESVPRADVEEPDAGSKDAQWLALADELGKRWELLGTVWLKKGDKTVRPLSLPRFCAGWDARLTRDRLPHSSGGLQGVPRRPAGHPAVDLPRARRPRINPAALRARRPAVAAARAPVLATQPAHHRRAL